jgi:hypothetical protein
MSETILATFDTPEEALRSARALRREGVAQVELLSAEPIHEAIADENSKSAIGWFAVLGAVIGAVAAILLTVLPSRHVNIVTGGMPIVSFWAFGVIVFEVAMLTAVIFALGRMLYEARLFSSRLKNYDEAVGDDKIVLVLHCQDEAAISRAKNLLDETSATIKPASPIL